MEEAGGSSSTGGRGAAPWTLTLADLMTLLLAFFVLLYSFANTDARKFRQVASSLQGAFGAPAGAPRGGAASAPELARTSEERLLDGLGAALERQGLADRVEIERGRRGFVVRAKGELFFAPGSADLLPGSLLLLDEVGELARALPHELAVIGHGDAVGARGGPPGGSWQLASARAIAALRHLIELGAVAPERVSAVSYGDARPLEGSEASPSDPANRRVEFRFQRPD